MRALVHRLLALGRRQRLDRELDGEIAAHLELAERDAIARGLSPEEARREARQAFGGLDGIREAHRDARSLRALEALWRDVAYGTRTLLRTPLVSALVVLVLGVAIGANATMFSAVRGILLQPLPYGDADALVIVMHHGRQPVSYANFDDWRRELRTFSAMGAAEYWRVNVGLDDGAERVLGLRVTEDTLPLLRVAPQLGHLPTPDAFRGGDSRQVVISHGLWTRRFGARPDVVGQPLRLDGEVHTVVAVMPRTFVFAPFWAVDAELWAPLPHAGRPTGRDHNSLRVFARLAEGVSIEQAQADVDAVTARLEATFPTTNRDVRVVPLKERVVGDTRLALAILMVGVLVVLAIACANVAHILLARAATRRREVAVRLALGATRTQIVRQFLVESLVLAGVAGMVGVGLAHLGIRALVALAPPDLPRVSEVRLDGAVLVFTVVMALATGLAFGLSPAWQAAQPAPGDALAAGRGASGDRRQARTRRVLMTTEVALSLVLVAAAGLMVRSLVALQSLDPGFDPRGVSSLSVSVQGTPEADPGRRPLFFRDIAERFAALPGVTGASAINHLPLRGDMWMRGFAIEGRPVAAAGEGATAVYRVVLPGYFETMRLPVRRGRDFTWQDSMDAPGVAIVSRNLARRHWPGRDPIGTRIVIGEPTSPDARWLTIVGIAEDAARETWDGGRGEEIYLPYLQVSDYLTRDAPQYTYLTYVIRIVDPLPASAPLAAARAAVAAAAPTVAVSDVTTMELAVARALARPRFQLWLLATCALIALALAAAGIYGVVSYATGRRLREIGLRLALGAQPREVRALVVRQASGHVLAGVALGIAGALAVGRLMTALLHGVSPTDPATLAAATIILLTVALVASGVPAWRASRVAPSVALRED